MSAKELFEKLGYELFLNNKETLMYRCKKDYVDNSVTFNLGNLFPNTYDVMFVDWWDNKSADWLPMSERREDLKHCATYGHWQKVDRPISFELHKAINKQIEELGWNND